MAPLKYQLILKISVLIFYCSVLYSITVITCRSSFISTHQANLLRKCYLKHLIKGEKGSIINLEDFLSEFIYHSLKISILTSLFITIRHSFN